MLQFNLLKLPFAVIVFFPFKHIYSSPAGFTADTH